MAKEKTKKKAESGNNEVLKPLDEDTRFKYIGFGVYSKPKKDFFKSEEEKKKYEKSVAEYNKTHFTPFKEFTEVKRNLLSTTDKTALTISSLILILSAFLPWMSFKTSWVSMSFSGWLGFFKASEYTDIIRLFNPNLLVYVYIPALLSLLAFIFGILTLIVLYMPAKTQEGHRARLKKILGLHWLPLTLWMAFFAVSIVGISLPFGEWMSENYGVKAIGDNIGIATFASLSGIGVWLSIAGLVLNAVKSNDL